MSVTSTVVRNTIFQATGRLVSLISSLVMIKLLTGYLGEAGFGNYSLVIDYLGFFVILVDLGLYLIAIQRIRGTSDIAERERQIGIIFGLRLASAALVLAIAVALIFLFPYSATVKIGVVLASSSFLFFTITQLLGGLFQGFLRAEYSAIGEVVSRLSGLLLIWICVAQDLGFEMMMLALVVGNGIGMVLSWHYSRAFIRIRPVFDLREFRQLLVEAIPIGVVATLTYLYVRQDTLILSLHPAISNHMSAVEAIGLYKAPYKLLESLQSFPGLFLAALFPFLTHYIAVKDPRLTSMSQKAFDVLIVIALPTIVGVVLLAHRIIPLLTSGGQDWTRSVLTMQLLIVAVGFSFINVMTAHLIMAAREQRRLIWPSVCYFTFNLVANVVLIHYLSYNGSAVATILTEALVCVVNFVVVKKVFDWLPSLGDVWRVLVAAALMGGATFWLDGLGVNVFVTVLMSTVVYFVVLHLVGGFPESMSIREIRARLGVGRS